MIISEHRKEQLREYQQRHRQTLKYRATALKNKARIRAQKKNLEFSLSYEFVKNKLEKGVCEVTGISLDCSVGPRNPYTPSLDRIDPSQGYTESNTRVVCWMYNCMKSDFSDQEVLEFLSKMKEKVC